MIRGLFLDIGNTLVADPFQLASQDLAEFIIRSTSSDLTNTDVVAALNHSNESVDGLGFSHFWGEPAIVSHALSTLGLPSDEKLVCECLSVYRDFVFKAYDTHSELLGLPKDELRELLSRIRRAGFVIGAISDERAASISRYWDVLGIHDLMDVVITSEEAGVGKPDPRMFRVALDRVGVSPGESTYVGNDYLRDVLGAQSVGMRAIYFTRFNKTPPAPDQTAAELTTDDLHVALEAALT